MIRILFTGVGRRVELIQAFRNAALVLNKSIIIYGSDLTGTAPALSYCDYYRKTVSMKDPGYIDNLLQICVEDGINLVIPTIDTDLLLLSESKERFKAIGVFVLISEPDKIMICRDKNYTGEFFTRCGLSAPLPVNDWREYKDGYPAFIKPKDGSSSINAYKVENEEELVVYAKQIGDYIIQRFISGQEYTIDVFCDWKGSPISIIPRKRLQVRAGEVLKTQICMEPSMISEMRVLCKEFKPCGPLTVQLIRDGFGKNWYIEINPRFGGGSPLSMKAGSNSAESILKLISDEKIDYLPEIEDGAVFSRFDQSVCIADGQKRIKGVIFDLDDTLYSEKEYVRSGFKAVSEYLGGGFEEKLWMYFQKGQQAIDELLIDLKSDNEKEKVLAVYRNHKPTLHLYPDAIKIIELLRKKNIKIGIITDGRPEGQRNKIEALGLDVDDIIITDELGGVQFRKPCDIAFRIMATRWRMYPEDIAYIGDNLEKDFQGPKQLGIKGIFFNNPDGLHFRPSYVKEELSVISCLDDLTSLFGGIK